MDITQYTDRLKYKSLPADFNHQDGPKYKSSWEYTKNFSNYHFDKWQVETEGEWIHKLGRFAGQWQEHIPAILEKSKDLGWDQSTNSNLRPGFTGGQSPMKAQEDYDRIQHGLKDTDQTNLVLESFIDTVPAIKAMVDHWKLEKPSYRIHVQWPGQCFGLHIDKLWHRCPTDPGRIVRLMIPLADYEPGQMSLFGNYVLTQYRAGDVYIFDTLNVPHASANLSVTPRPNMVITGLRTPETDEALRNANPDAIYNV